MLWSLAVYVFALIGFLAMATYMIPFIIVALLPTQNLKRKYGAKWALVTGGSSGIGKAICLRLAEQGINIVIAALEDDFLHKTTAELQAAYPKLEFRKCAVNMSNDAYLPVIVEATKDIPVSLVFNNAGYMKQGFFANVPYGAVMANYECNATACVRITHHFSNRMINEKLSGLIAFTSSPSGRFPNPSAAMYGATKAFVSEFAASIAPELRVEGIDVLVVHPSPVDSQFYANAQGSAVAMFKTTATTPDVIAQAMFSSAGRVVVRDQGYLPCVFKLLLTVLDCNLFALITNLTASTTGDFKKFRAERNKAK